MDKPTPTDKAWIIATVVLAVACVYLFFMKVPAAGVGNMNGMDMQMSHGGMNMQGAMDGMMSGLTGKTGADFDKAFLSEMIVHHQGAVDMAQLALTNAQHQEIKDLARAIIAAQNKEIADMKSWQKVWFK